MRVSGRASRLPIATLFDARFGGLAIVICALLFPAPAQALTCTVKGTARADVLKGTAAADVICTLGGNDTIYGRGGNDRIYAGAGADKVYGGTGADVIIGGPGSDTLSGGPGNDALRGGLGRDTVSFAGSGRGVSANLVSRVATGQGSDKLRGDENLVGSRRSDRLTGDSANNSLAGGGGNDTLNGGSGNDSEAGGLGNDQLHGAAGNDGLRGNNGDDTLDGGAGEDTLNGNDGTDDLNGGNGNDLISGGPGSDTADYSDHTADITATIAGTGGSGQAGEADTIEADVENLMGGSGNDALSGNEADNTLRGGGGDDTLDGRGGADIVNGNDGADVLHGGDGNDTLIGGPGDDFLDGDAGTNPCIGGYDNDVYVAAHCEDVTPPKIVSFDFDPKTIDTSGGSQSITFTARFRDDLSGYYTSEIIFVSPNGQQTIDFNLCVSGCTGTRVAGDAFDGVYEATVSVPQFSQFGTWTVLQYFSRDVVGNNTFVNPAASYFFDQGFPTTITNG
jgi:Ca2+-binding RTX toxin-like protein